MIATTPASQRRSRDEGACPRRREPPACDRECGCGQQQRAYDRVRVAAMLQQVIDLAADERIEQVDVGQVAADRGRGDQQVAADFARQAARIALRGARDGFPEQRADESMRDIVHGAGRADAKVTNSTQLASAMIVGSGAAHAIVNAVLKSGKDKMSSRALIDGFSALLMFPAAFFLPLPHGAWGWLAASARRPPRLSGLPDQVVRDRGHERGVPDCARRGAGARSGGRGRVLRRADQRLDRMRHRAGLQRSPAHRARDAA